MVCLKNSMETLFQCNVVRLRDIYSIALTFRSANESKALAALATNNATKVENLFYFSTG